MARFIIEVKEGQTHCDKTCPLYFKGCTQFDIDCEKYDLSTIEITEDNQ